MNAITPFFIFLVFTLNINPSVYAAFPVSKDNAKIISYSYNSPELGRLSPKIVSGRISEESGFYGQVSCYCGYFAEFTSVGASFSASGSSGLYLLVIATILLGLAAIVLGGFSFKKGRRQKGAAIFGIILGFYALILLGGAGSL